MVACPDVTDANEADLLLETPHFSAPSVFGWLSLADYVGSVLTNYIPKSSPGSCLWTVAIMSVCFVGGECEYRELVRDLLLSWQNFLRVEPGGTLKKGWKTKWMYLLDIQIKAFGCWCRRAAVTEGVETKYSGSVWIKTAGLASSDICWAPSKHLQILRTLWQELSLKAKKNLYFHVIKELVVYEISCQKCW